MEENVNNDLWLNLQAVMPESQNISEKQRSKLYGLVRRSLLWEKEDAVEALHVFRPESIEELRSLIQSLTISTADEITAAIEELHLSEEEKELEYAHWSFRRQSSSGEMLIQDKLLGFKLVRLNQYQYMLLSPENNLDLADSFTHAFNRAPDVFSRQVITIEAKRWAGWMWILDPDKERTRQIKEEISALWKVKG